MDVTPLRLRSQQLVDPTARTAHDLVRHFGALQGQEYGPTKWGIGLRLPHLQDADIEMQLNEGRILRTHLLRPTWHLVTDEDIRWLLRLTAPRVHQLNGYMYRSTGLDAAEFSRYNRLIVNAISGGMHLTREELGSVFLRNGAQADGIRLGLIMMQAELEGIVCSGRRQGTSHTYALLDERVKSAPPKTRDEALAALTRRYFQSRGPATVKDFAGWSSLTIADCRRGVEMLRPTLTDDHAEGGQYIYFRDTCSDDAPPRLHILPIYDEYIMGYKDRAALLRFRSSLGKPPFRFDNMIVWGGQIVGTWRRDLRRNAIDLVWDCFQTPEKSQTRLLRAAAELFGKFHRLPVSLHQFDPGSTNKLHRPGWQFSN
ncbi:MAG: AlkZ family DNA glycosylase [Bryobacteraceae bacterium]|nr:AlkZ family DNA glycosylase [Bryobacteraceae bacterium]